MRRKSVRFPPPGVTCQISEIRTWLFAEPGGEEGHVQIVQDTVVIQVTLK